MAQLYDLHCHLGFAPDAAATALEAQRLGLSALCCTVEPNDYEPLRRLLEPTPDLRPALGLHPWQVADAALAAGTAPDAAAIATASGAPRDALPAAPSVAAPADRTASASPDGLGTMSPGAPSAHPGHIAIPSTPHDTLPTDLERQLELFEALAPDALLIGEVGLDFAGPRADAREAQVAALRRILAAAPPRSGRLYSLHAVRSADVLLDLLEEAGVLPAPGAGHAGRTPDEPASASRGTSSPTPHAPGEPASPSRGTSPAGHAVIFHWFSGTSQELARARDLGCFFSVGPRMLATRRGRAYAHDLPLDRLVLETDAPSRPGELLSAAGWLAQLTEALTALAAARGTEPAALAPALAATSKRLLAR
ncbi:MAG: hypothetical protein HFJ75_01800 [Eggerthellaceae bacterium]|nr:hypothetical protein [Eggerthellaceae bacterium]